MRTKFFLGGFALTVPFTVIGLIFLSFASGGAKGSSAEQAKSGHSKSGGNLIIGYRKPFKALDNTFALDPISRTLTACVQDGLYEIIAQGKEGRQSFIRPVLATGMPSREDALHYRVDLRPGVTFSTGQPLTAADVVFTFHRVTGGAHKSPAADAFETIETIEAESSTSLRITLKHPTPLLPLLLARPELFPVSRSLVLSQGRLYGKVSVSGTGPYMLDHMDEDGTILLTRNPHYSWVSAETFLLNPLAPNSTPTPAATPTSAPEQVPYYDSVTFRRYADSWELFEALRKGKIQMVLGVEPEEIQEESKAMRWVGEPNNRLVQVYLNNQAAPFDRPEIRKALVLATDREDLREVFGGRAVAAQGPFPAWCGPLEACGENAEAPCAQEYNPELAATILRALGYSVQDPLVFPLLVTREPVFERIADLLVEQWRQAGFCAEPLFLPKKELFSLVYGSRGNPDAEYRAALEDWQDFRRGADPDQFYDALYASNSLKNKVNYNGIDTLIEMVAQMDLTGELGWGLGLVRNRLIEDAPACPLLFPQEGYLTRGVRGVEWGLMGYAVVRGVK